MSGTVMVSVDTTIAGFVFGIQEYDATKNKQRTTRISLPLRYDQKNLLISAPDMHVRSIVAGIFTRDREFWYHPNCRDRRTDTGR